MARPALRIKVTPKDQKELRKLLRGGVQQVRVVLRAMALLQLAKGVSAPRVSTQQAKPITGGHRKPATADALVEETARLDRPPPV